MMGRRITVTLTERQAEETLAALGSYQMEAQDDGDIVRAMVIWRADQAIRGALLGYE